MDNDVLGWVRDQGNMGKNTHMPVDPELALYIGGLVFLWEVAEREGSLPCLLEP